MKVARKEYTWITLCVKSLLVVTLIQIILITGINSQNTDSQTGPLLHNVKEPPDLLYNANLQNTIIIANNRNDRRSNVPVNYRPMKFICSRRIPVFMSRRNVPAQTTPSPFTLSAIPEVTETNKVLHVKIDSRDGQPFKSFMIQVLSAEPGADDRVLGEFIPTPNANLQTCYSNSDTVTSADKSKRTSATVTWKAPPNMKVERVIVRATIVRDYRTYWIDIKSNTVSFLDTDTASTETTGDETSNTADHTNTSDDNKNSDLVKSIANTFEGFDGPFESADEVLIHQGIRKVEKLDGESNTVPEVNDKPGIVIAPPKFDEPPTAPLPPPRYIYKTMNKFAPDFEPPTTSEFVGQLLGNMLTGGNRQQGPAAGGGGGGLGSMMNMMGMASKMFGGGGGGGGGGLMSSLGTMSKLGGMLGGGSGRGGGLGGLGALSSMLGNGGGSRNSNAPPQVRPPTSGGGGGMGGALSSLLGGFGNKNKNVAPMPVGAPVNPNRNNEPSLADLLGVDPSIGIDNTPTVIPAEANPIAGVSAAKAGGGLLSKIGGFAPMLAMAPIALTMFGSKKKNQQQQMPFGGGQPGQFGMPGSPGQFGRPGSPGQFGMPPGQGGQFGMPPGQRGQFGMQPGQQGQFGGAPGQFGRPPPQGFGGFGPTTAPAWQTTTTPAASDKSIQQIIQLLEAQRLQIEALKNQIGGASITSQMGGFGNIPLSFGQKTNAQLLGLSGQNGLTGGLNGLGGIGSTLSTFEPVGPPKVEQKPQSSSNNDLLLQQLIQQNQMLMQQNRQFQTNMLNAPQGQGQFGGTSGSTFNRVNRSNGQTPTNTGINPVNSFGQNTDLNNLQQTQNNGFQSNGLTNGQLPTSAGGGLLNSGQAGFMNAGTGGANNAFNNMPSQGVNSVHSSNGGGQGHQSQQTGGSAMFGQFGGSNQGATGGTGSAGAPANVGGISNQGSSGSGGSLTSMFGGGGGGSSNGGGGGGGLGGLMGSMLGGGDSGGGSPLAGLMGGGGGGGPDIGGLMSSMLGGGNGGGGMDMSKILGSVDMNAMQGMLSGDQGQDLMKSVNGLLSGPAGGDLMKAMEGMMSGNGNPADIMGLMGKMDMNELQGMAKQAEGLMASSGIDPSQILGMMGR